MWGTQAWGPRRNLRQPAWRVSDVCTWVGRVGVGSAVRDREGDRVFVLTSRCSFQGRPSRRSRGGRARPSEPLRGRPGLAVLDEGSLFLASVSL